MIATHLLLFNVYLACWLIIYRLCFSHTTFFALNRWLLLSGILLAALGPWAATIQLPVLPRTAMGAGGVSGSTVFVAHPAIITASGARAVWHGATIVYWLGVVVMATLLASKVWRLYRIYRHSPHERHARHLHVITPEGVPVFSFGRWLFAPRDVAGTIYRHELAHIVQMHTLDVLLLEILKIFCWFNPLVYAYQRTLSYLHEYQADAAASQVTGASAYAEFLVRQVFRMPDYPMVHHFFNRSLIQKRLIMLQKKKHPARAVWTYTGLAILLALLLLASSRSFGFRRQVDRLVSGLNPAGIQAADSVEGLVTDHSGVPLAKVTVVALGSRTGVLTDEKGRFSLHGLNGKSMLRFSMVGYSPVTIGMPASGMLKVELYKEFNSIHSLTVVGYANGKSPSKAKSSSKAKAFTFVEKMPEFPGGEKELFNYLSRHISYPQEARQRHIEGTVMVKFIVDRRGGISDVQTINNPLGGGLDEEALRVVKSMPPWNPGRQNGTPVDVWYAVPIKFVLQ